MTATEDERRARATWSALAEPGDLPAGALVRALGAPAAVEWAGAAARGAPDWSALPGLPGPSRMRLVAATRRWEARSQETDADALLADLGRFGGALVVPGDDAWPVGLDDLGDGAPFALWCRGDLPGTRAAVAIVGSRASTGYGERVAFDLAHGLVTRGVAVVSGGAVVHWLLGVLYRLVLFIPLHTRWHVAAGVAQTAGGSPCESGGPALGSSGNRGARGLG